MPELNTIPPLVGTYWAAREVLFKTCPSCFRTLCWRRQKDKREFVATCHQIVWVATPLYEGVKWQLSAGKVDHSNVRVLSVEDV